MQLIKTSRSTYKHLKKEALLKSVNSPSGVYQCAKHHLAGMKLLICLLTLTSQCFHRLSREARVKGVMLRWWQPRHDGVGHDQWALDHVEVVLWVPNSQPVPAPQSGPQQSPICPCLYLCLSITCRNGPIYSTQTQQYRLLLDFSTYTCVVPTYHLQWTFQQSVAYLLMVSDKQGRKMTAMCFALKGFVCGWLFCVFDRLLLSNHHIFSVLQKVWIFQIKQFSTKMSAVL